jgi:hypothetical protein
VVCPVNSADFCCGGTARACVAGDCCATEDCSGAEVCQDNTCTGCDAVTGRNYFVDPVNGDDGKATGSGRAGSASAPNCAFKTLTHAFEHIGSPTQATTVTIVGPATLGKSTTAANGEATLPFAVPANVTIRTQGGAVTLSLADDEQGFSFAAAPAALQPATALTIVRSGAGAEPQYGIHVEPTTGTGAIAISNVALDRAGANGGAVEIAAGTVTLSNVAVTRALQSGIRITGGTATLSNVTVGIAGTANTGAVGNGIEVSAGDVTIGEGVQVVRSGQNGLAVSGGAVTISNAPASNTATLFSNNTGSGIAVSGATAVLSLTGAISGSNRSVRTESNASDNVLFESTATSASSINSLYSFGSTGDGLQIRANSRISVRNSTFLGNAGSGIHIAATGTGTGANDDVAFIDLGSAVTPGTSPNRGGNTLQVAALPTAANRNTLAGLCIDAFGADAPARTLEAQANLFAGATTGSYDCGTSATPAHELDVAGTCAGNADIGIPATSPVTVAADYCVFPSP